jgi:hypothetical protein
MGEGGKVGTETQKNKNNEAKAHWSPRWPNNDIRKRHRKSTIKCEGIALRFVAEGMFLKKLHSKWKKFEKPISLGKGVAWKEGKEMSGRPPTRFLRSCSLEC